MVENVLSLRMVPIARLGPGVFAGNRTANFAKKSDLQSVVFAEPMIDPDHLMAKGDPFVAFDLG